jgi:hypothetical protein
MIMELFNKRSRLLLGIGPINTHRGNGYARNSRGTAGDVVFYEFRDEVIGYKEDNWTSPTDSLSSSQ